MKTAIAAFLVLLGLTNPVFAATYTFKSCSPNTKMAVKSFNYNDAAKMIPASSAFNMRDGDTATLNCGTDKCFVKVNIEFLETSKPLRVQRDISPMVTDGGSVCLKVGPLSWNYAKANVSYGQCSC